MKLLTRLRSRAFTFLHCSQIEDEMEAAIRRKKKPFPPSGGRSSNFSSGKRLVLRTAVYVGQSSLLCRGYFSDHARGT